MANDTDIDWDNAVWDEEKGEMVLPNTSVKEKVVEDIVIDSNGVALSDGDSVQTTKDLDIKGMPKTLKRGTVVKGIRLNDGITSINCKIGKAQVQILTEYLKKA